MSHELVHPLGSVEANVRFLRRNDWRRWIRVLAAKSKTTTKKIAESVRCEVMGRKKEMCVCVRNKN